MTCAKLLLCVLCGLLFTQANATEHSVPDLSTDTSLTYTDNSLRSELLERINQVQQHIEMEQLAGDRLATQLRRSEQQRIDLTIELTKGRVQLQRYNQNLEKLRGQSISLQARATKEKTYLAELLRRSYMHHNYPPLRIALAISDKRNWSRHLTYLRYILIDRTRLTHRAIKSSQEIQKLVTDQEKLSTQIRQQNRAISDQIQRVQRIEKQRTEVLQKIRRNITEKGNELQTYQQSVQRLEQLAQSIGQLRFDELTLQRKFAHLRGNIPLPIDEIKSITNNFSFVQKGKAVIVSAPIGTPVTSIANGQVVFANWIRGLGLVAIVDHADEYLSLYAHNQRILAKVGQWVKKGDTISFVGDSGGNTQSGVFMQILHRGKPVALDKWLNAYTLAQIRQSQ